MYIQSLELAAGDLNSLTAFYIDKLGLTGDLETGRLTIQAGSTTLSFKEGAAAPYHFAFNIPENSLDAAADWLESLNITLLPDPGNSRTHEFLSWNADAVYFLDPANNVVELIARHELPNSLDPDGPFTVNKILCVSEIGIATADVPAKAAELATDYLLTEYREADETFAPMGDANGLCIVVPIGRPWYPTANALAAELPLRLTFSAEDGSVFVYTSGSRG